MAAMDGQPAQTVVAVDKVYTAFPLSSDYQVNLQNFERGYAQL